MPGFLYFVPNLDHEPQPKELAEKGLAYAIEDRAHGTRVENVFGQHGFLLADRQRVTELGRVAFHAEQQQWQKWTPPGKSPLWVGMYRDAPPTPGSLQRRTTLEGPMVELLDGSRWQIPVARQWSMEGERLVYEAMLPQVGKLNDEGQWTLLDVVPRYRQLWELTVKYYDVITFSASDQEREAFYGGMFDHAAAVVGGNYLVGPAELSLLGVLSPTECKAILDALIQRPVLEDLVQKKMSQSTSVAGSAASPGSSSSPGPAAETTATAPP